MEHPRSLRTVIIVEASTSPRFKEATCHFCKIPGHLALVCRSKAKQKASTGERKTHCLTTDNTDSSSGRHSIQQTDSGTKPYIVKVTLNHAPLDMELDTGAAVSLISKATYDHLWKTAPQLVPTTTRLRMYSGQQLVVLGTLTVTVKYEAQQVVHPIIMVDGAGPSLLERDLLAVLKLKWSTLAVQYTTRYPPLEEILAKYAAVFRNELGKAKNITATLHLDDRASLKFCNARPVPYALREEIDRELERLQKYWIIQPIQFSDWAAPVVPVTKADGSLRLCGDYKLTINKAAKLDSYSTEDRTSWQSWQGETLYKTGHHPHLLTGSTKGRVEALCDYHHSQGLVQVQPTAVRSPLCSSYFSGYWRHCQPTNRN